MAITSNNVMMVFLFNVFKLLQNSVENVLSIKKNHRLQKANDGLIILMWMDD
jgi:hypothetical protein